MVGGGWRVGAYLALLQRYGTDVLVALLCAQRITHHVVVFAVTVAVVVPRVGRPRDKVPGIRIGVGLRFRMGDRFIADQT